jgi:hypothetical protein
MIEIYLATLLFGLGTVYNQAQKKTPLKEQNNSSDQDTNPYNQNIIKKVKKAETDLGAKLDVKCKSILPRNFSNLLDEETSKLLNENEDVLKYIPKTDNKIKSALTGEEVDLDQFITSQTIGRDNKTDVSSNTWAIPYFKGTATQNMSLDGYQNKLDIHTGRSEFNFHKKETKNFFKPNKDVSFVNGSPHVIDKLEQRYVKSNNRNTELPFEQIRVGRGVGQSYGNKGKGGFHQFEINEIAKPKTVDELRSISNPKKTYSEPVQTGKSFVDKRSSITKVVRHRPEKTHHQSKKDFIAPKSVNTKNTHRSKFILKKVNPRHRSHSGHAAPASKVNHMLKASIKKDTKNTYINYSPDNPSNAGAWNIKNPNNREEFQSDVKIETNYDISSYGKDSIKLPPNERDTTQDKTIVSNLISAVKSIIAPLQDKMKRTRKENIEGNPNISGYMGTSIPKKQTAYDPKDIARTTIRETTEKNEHAGNMDSGIKKLTVYDPNDIARTTIKETTEVNKNETQIKGATKLTVYDPNDVARTTLKETLIHDTRDGNISVERKKISDYNYASAKQTMKETTIDNIHHTNISYNRGDGKGYLTANPFAPATMKQLTSDNEYGGNIHSGQLSKGGRESNKYYAPATQKQFTSDNEYTGGANSYSKNTTNYNSMLNARTNPNKEIISQGRAPTQTGVKVMASTYEQGGTLYKKQNAVIAAGDHSTISITNGGSIPSNALGNSVTKPRVSLSTRGLEEKINPNTLNQLNNNPYHLSINRSNDIIERFTDTDTDTDSYFGDLML